MISNDQKIRAAIAERAGEWFVANDDGPLGAPESAALAAWLKASPVHVEEFLAVSAIARDLPAAGDDPEFSLDALLEAARRDSAEGIVALESPSRGGGSLAKRSGMGPSWRLAAAAALGALVVAASLLWWSRDGERFGLARTYETARGEQGRWRLPDGSTLHLNTDSRVTVRYSPTERVVVLGGGEALFAVAHGDRRRFRVSAGEAQVLAVGTEFDVYRRRDTTLVTVVEGTVEVSAGEAPPWWKTTLRPVRYAVATTATVATLPAVTLRATRAKSTRACAPASLTLVRKRSAVAIRQLSS